MADPRGSLTVMAGGKNYRLWLGMSVLADLQDKHGQDVLQQLEQPADAGDGWLPPMRILVDLFMLSLERYHSDDAEKYLASDIIAENPDAFQDLIAAAFPDQKPASGNAKRPKRAA